MAQPKVQLASLLRCVVSFGGQEKICTVQKSDAFIGRTSAEFPADIDLSLDTNVSRRHARLWQETGAYWIEDLGSRGGTLLNGIEIKGQGKRPLPPVGAVVEAGATKIRVEIPADPIHSFLLLPPGKSFDITVDLEMSVTKMVLPDSISALQNLSKLLEYPLQLFSTQNLHDLLSITLEKALEIVPADSGAILLNSRNYDALHLSAFIGEPILSEALARRAIAKSIGFTWHENDASNFGLCVVMLWNTKPLGVICLNRRGNEFSSVDLLYAIAMSRYAACALDKALTK